MSLSRRTFLIISTSLMILIVLLSFLAAYFILANVTDYEQEQAYGRIDRMLFALDNEFTTLDSKIYEWSEWDDTYEYIADPYDEFVIDNLGEGTSLIGEPAYYLEFSEIDIMIFLNLDADPILARGYDKETSLYTDIPVWLRDELTPDNPLFDYPDISAGNTGIIFGPTTQFLVVTRPVLDSAGEGPVRGTVLMGRYIDEDTVTRLEEITQMQLMITRLDSPNLATDLRQATRNADCLQAEEAPQHSQTLDQERIAAYTCMPDIYGETGIIVLNTSHRTMYQQGIQSIIYLVFALVIGGAVIGGMTLMMLQRGVISRLQNLSERVNGISLSRAHTERIPEEGNDEITSLTRDINTMIGTLVQTKKIQASEERYALAVRGSNDGLWDWDIETDTFYFSPRWKSMLGYEEHEIAHTFDAWMQLIHPDDRDALQSALLSHQQGETTHFQHECRMLHQDGDWRWMLSRGMTAQNERGRIIRMAGSQTDTTHLKQAEETIRVQESTVRELSTPLIPLTERVIMMPLIGTMTNQRVQQMTETLLKGITAHKARIVILDATGLDIVDTEVADTILRLTHAVRLLGSRLLLSGIRPDVAQVLVHLEADLGMIQTYSSLQEAIARALGNGVMRKP